MQNPAPPAARYQRFERVSIANRRNEDGFVGHRGTVIWCDRPRFDRRIGAWTEWIYSVSFPDLKCCHSFLESDLEPTGEFDTEQSQWGSRYEISYDLEMSDDMGFVEGAYRLPGHLWQVLIVGKTDVPDVRHFFGTWESGITGLELEVPLRMIINHDFVIEVMSDVFGAVSWIVVNGPDSMILR